jgi:hypothetical protein
MTHCLEKLGPISQCRCAIAQRNSLLQRSENLKTSRVSGTSRILTDFLCRCFVVSCFITQFHLHIRGFPIYVSSSANDIFRRKGIHVHWERHVICTSLMCCYRAGDYGRPWAIRKAKIQFTETLYFYINPNVWCSWKKNADCRRIFKLGSRRTQNDGSKN